MANSGAAPSQFTVFFMVIWTCALHADPISYLTSKLDEIPLFRM